MKADMLPERHDLSRRDWISRVLLQAASVSALAGADLYAADSQQSTSWHPAFLTESQDRSLIALGEQIIPGSGPAHCDRVIDLILSIETPQTQQAFKEALGTFLTEAQRRFGKDLGNLAPAQIDGLLRAAASPNESLHVSFALLKEWFADAYWSSQEGMRELGWKGRVAWSGFDGCTHASSHSST